MVSVHVTENGAGTIVTGAEGSSLMEVLRNAGITGIIGECGGAAACASCHVFVDSDWFARLGSMDDAENDMLDFAATERTEFSRLSCQITLGAETDGLRVTVPAEN
jgi:2Fe-2S ferredoxin